MDKYYTPELEDLFIGYECEWFGELGRKLIKQDKQWQKFKIISSNNISPTVIKNLRTKYLTIEDIENEGWKNLNIKSPFTGKDYKFSKIVDGAGFNETSIYTLTFHSPNELKIHLETETSYLDINETIYYGKCPSINEFKKITKLLGI